MQENIREYVAEFKKALARESGAQEGWDCLMKKTEGRKFRATVPLSCVFV
jgi:hypothetical protein